jgi:diadenosine tetraphosphate (Ap4A) HIT family hydrolase
MTTQTDVEITTCRYCDRHSGAAELPPGGYLYEDEHWQVGHAMTEWTSEAGSVIVEARRHVLDFADFTDAEAASFGALMRRLYPAIKHATGAERVYLVSTMAVMPHFHAWLVPWLAGSDSRGIDFLAREGSITAEQALAASAAIREGMAASVPAGG